MVSVSRVLSRVLSVSGGHSCWLFGSLTSLAPLCLALLNGGEKQQSTDTIVPKEEIRLLLRQRPFVHLTVWDPNPLLTAIAPQPSNPHTDPSTAATTGDAEGGGAVQAEFGLSSRSSASDGVSVVGGEAAPSPTSASVSLLALLSWTLGNGREQGQAEHELSEKQRQLRRLSRQRTHVHGQSEERLRFGTIAPVQGA